MSYLVPPDFTDDSDNPFILHSMEEKPVLAGHILAIGNFDGVHRGHRAIAQAAQQMRETLSTIPQAKGQATPPRPRIMILTFQPHPRAFFQSKVELFHLLDRDGQKNQLATVGFEGRITLPFNAEMAKMQAEAFVEQVLLARYAVQGVVVGADFHFGHKRAGTPDFLVSEGRRLGFAVSLVPPVQMADGSIISSSAIRAALAAGDVPRANAMLGYEYAITGMVIHGEKRGRTLGYPTANIRLPAGNGLRHGIYAVFAEVDGTRHAAVASFGRRPTFDNGAPLLEVHLFDYEGDLYGKTPTITFIAFLRGEARFESLDALIRQMDADSANARAVLTLAQQAAHA